MAAQSPVETHTVPGRMLTQPQWLAARIAETGETWGNTVPRVAGTMWWCMLASALVQQVARAYATDTPAPAPELARLDCEVRTDGGIEVVHILPSDGIAECAAALRETLATVIPVVAAVSGAGAPALWAVVTDAIGNRALDAGSAEAGSRLAREIGGRLVAPRFVEIGGRTFVKRLSCCLVFEFPGCEMCTSCPKRTAADRESRLAELAAQG
ncbi:(2Fe-2S)-binding protein [Nocardia panacis]|nr:(2Fe-2S)-binding protein [Nocardia panacis]